MRLSELAASQDASLSELAVAVGVKPLFLERVNVGRQAMPRFLAVLIARAIGVDVADVMASCPLTTELSGDATLTHAIPPEQGEPCPPARIVPTVPVVIPTPASEVLYVLSYGVASPDDSSVLQQYSIRPGGGLTLLSQILQSDDGFAGDLDSLVHGAVAVDGTLWLRGGTPDTEPVTARVDASSLAMVAQGPLTGPYEAFAKVAVDPATGWLWLTVEDGSLYRFNPSDLAAGALTLDLTANGEAQLCGAMLFPGDGFLYAATWEANTGTQIVQKIDPDIAAPSVVATSATPFPSDFGESVLSLEWVASASKLYSGYVGGILEWDMDTLDPTFIGNDGSKLLCGGAYDSVTDSFWFVEQNTNIDPQYLAARVSRLTGIPDFEGDAYDAPVARAYPPIISRGRSVFFPTMEPGNDSPDINSVTAYTMDGTPVVLSSTLVGSGPDPTGENNRTASLVYLRR